MWYICLQYISQSTGGSVELYLLMPDFYATETLPQSKKEITLSYTDTFDFQNMLIMIREHRVKK